MENLFNLFLGGFFNRDYWKFVYIFKRWFLWYQSIKPSFTPPNYVFPIVWNILFFLIAISLYLAWTSAKKKEMKRKIAAVFGMNLLLNFLWSFLFFAKQNPVGAFFDLIALLITIVAMIYTTYKVNKTSAYLLVPYLLWVSFAGFLNWIIAFPLSSWPRTSYNLI